MKRMGVLILAFLLIFSGCSDNDEARLISGYGAKTLPDNTLLSEDTLRLLDTFVSWHIEEEPFVMPCECGGTKIFVEGSGIKIDNFLGEEWMWEGIEICEDNYNTVDELYKKYVSGEYVCNDCNLKEFKLLEVRESVCRKYIPYDEMTKIIQRGSRSYKVF